jgi:hypothetical protein
LDLTVQEAVNAFFDEEKPEYVFLAAARVGGIHANNTYPAQFIYENIAIQSIRSMPPISPVWTVSFFWDPPASIRNWRLSR